MAEIQNKDSNSGCNTNTRKYQYFLMFLWAFCVYFGFFIWDFLLLLLLLLLLLIWNPFSLAYSYNTHSHTMNNDYDYNWRPYPVLSRNLYRECLMFLFTKEWALRDDISSFSSFYYSYKIPRGWQQNNVYNYIIYIFYFNNGQNGYMQCWKELLKFYHKWSLFLYNHPYTYSPSLLTLEVYYQMVRFWY